MHHHSLGHVASKPQGHSFLWPQFLFTHKGLPILSSKHPCTYLFFSVLTAAFPPPSIGLDLPLRIHVTQPHWEIDSEALLRNICPRLAVGHSYPVYLLSYLKPATARPQAQHQASSPSPCVLLPGRDGKSPLKFRSHLPHLLIVAFLSLQACFLSFMDQKNKQKCF